ncbi:MAG TPA: amidohydrolase family protein, partial [bacterium]|nr:amidohydrolase family protein [bacterium]
SWRVAPLLKEHNIPVIITDTHAIPGREDEDYDLRYKLPKLLQDAGVTFAITIDGSWQQRNLAFQAGSGVAFGLTKEEALTAITKSPAEILGISDRMGTIEKGKDATLIVVNGDILDMRSSIVEQAFIQGRGINLGNKQTDLYQRFKKKYDQN